MPKITKNGQQPLEASDTDVCLQEAATPNSIEARSFAIIDAEVPEPRPFSGAAWQVARRLVHTSGDPSLLESLWLPEDSIEAGISAIRSGAAIFTDTEMARAGIPLRRVVPFGCEVTCMLSQPGLEQIAASRGITRSRAGVEALAERLAGAIVAIGNAPTALLALLEYLEQKGKAPALIIGMPVGFVNAEESKELLLRWQAKTGQAALILRGRRGGSPLAAAAVNALAELASAEGEGAVDVPKRP